MYSERHPSHDTARSMAVDASQHDKLYGRDPKWSKNRSKSYKKKQRIITGVILFVIIAFLVANYAVSVATGNPLLGINENKGVYESAVYTERFTLGFVIYELKGTTIDTYRVANWIEEPELPYIMSREQKQLLEAEVHDFILTEYGAEIAEDNKLHSGIYIHDALTEGGRLTVYGWYGGALYSGAKDRIEETYSCMMIAEGRLDGESFIVNNVLLGDDETLKEKIPSVAIRSMDEEGGIAAVERAKMAAKILEEAGK